MGSHGCAQLNAQVVDRVSLREDAVGARERRVAAAPRFFDIEDNFCGDQHCRFESNVACHYRQGICRFASTAFSRSRAHTAHSRFNTNSRRRICSSGIAGVQSAQP